MRLLPQSISARLLLIFIIGFIVLISLLSVSFGHSLKTEVRNLHAHSVLRVTRITLDRRSQKVDWERAEQVARRAEMKIYIDTENSRWASEGEFLDIDLYQFSALPFKKNRTGFSRNEHSASLEVAEDFNTSIYKVTTPSATFYFEMEKGRRKLTWYFFAITGLFLLLLYLAIRYQFSPVADIKRVVREVSDGNFKARTNSKRKDDLGLLANQVDQMAADIDRSMESKRSLLLGISHELRTPLTRAKISADMLRDENKKASLLEDISEMESIITELIEAEKLSEDKALSRQATDINALINELIEQSFGANNVDFKPLADSPFVNIDPIRVKLLVKNLLKNAIKYSNENSDKPRVILGIDEKILTIEVIDVGIGMPADLLDRLTEPFYRLDQARQRETGGFGLGLYLCQAIANAHKGQLIIESELHQGTHVTAELLINI